MKINKWTLGLAAVGLVSLVSVAKADEKTTPLLTTLSSTVISGYVDTSVNWTLGTGDANPAPFSFNSGKQDGFNLNVIGLTLEKPLDEGQWSAGYKADLIFGPDAVGYNTSVGAGDSDFGIKQAYIALRAPVGNGLDFKVGVFDTPIGYETFVGYNNPNYTRSYGYTIEPTEHTGILASYQINDMFAVSAGMANTLSAGINARAQQGSSGITGSPLGSVFNAAYEDAGIEASDVAGFNSKAESYKTYMGAVTITAPESMGCMAGSALYAGVVNGYNNSVLGSGAGANQTSWYVGSTLATPVTGLRLGAAFDYADIHRIHSADLDINAKLWAYSFAGYASFQATEKLSLHGRAEYVKAHAGVSGAVDEAATAKIMALTGTVQYDLWQNVISRLEIRWDHSLSGEDLFGGNTAGEPSKKNEVMVAANLIYKF